MIILSGSHHFIMELSILSSILKKKTFEKKKHDLSKYFGVIVSSGRL